MNKQILIYIYVHVCTGIILKSNLYLIIKLKKIK